MKKQQMLFGGVIEESPEPKRKKKRQTSSSTAYSTPLIDPEILDKTPSEEYLGRIKDEMYLWDMRCWDERSRDEATKWVKELKEGSPENKNCGHVAWCIRKLLRRGVEEELIIDVMMANKKIQYRNRLVKCFNGIVTEDFKNHSCPKAREAEGYNKCDCGACEDPKDVKRNHAKPKKKLAKEATRTRAGE